MNKRLVSIICAAALFTQTLPTNAIATTSFTRNESIKRATGKYIMFMDNDDYLDLM